MAALGRSDMDVAVPGIGVIVIGIILVGLVIVVVEMSRGAVAPAPGTGAGGMGESGTNGSVEAAPGGTGASRSVLLISAIVIGIVVLAVLVVIAASRPPTTYPAGSPEATIQGFLGANDDGDPEAAYAFFSQSVRDSMTAEDYRRAWTDYGWEREQDRRVVLQGVDLSDSRATVHLRVDVYSGGGPFGSSRYTYDRSVGLVREGDVWRIDEPLVGLEPIPYYY